MTEFYFILHSDNYDKALVTAKQYDTIRLQMSTGEFCTHIATFINSAQYSILKDDPSYTDITNENVEDYK